MKALMVVILLVLGIATLKSSLLLESGDVEVNPGPGEPYRLSI